MPDWEAYVRRRLRLEGMKPEREKTIVREVAAQLEEFFNDARSRGASEAEAKTYTHSQVKDWQCFESEIRRADRRHERSRLDRWHDGTSAQTIPRGGLSTMFTDLHKDVLYGARMLMKKPAFTVVAVMTLALGIGANTAIFSVIDAVLLQPLPYPEPDRLVRVREFEPSFGTMSTSWLNYVDWRDGNRTFDSITSVQGEGYTLNTDGTPIRISGLNVTANFLSTLGVEPLLGRNFLPEEDLPGGERVVLLGHDLWQKNFGGNPDITGQTTSFNGEPFVIIGVMPAGFLADRNDFFTSLGINADDNDNRGNHPGIRTYGRMKPGVTVEQADADLNAIAAGLAEQFPVTNEGNGVQLRLYQEDVVRGSRPMLLILLGAVALVLLIGCVNVANLLLARATGRQKEMAVRAALGAGRLRLVRQLLTESMLIAMLGGAAGGLLAYWGLNLLKVVLPGGTPRLAQAEIDVWILGFALSLSLLTGVLFGLAPAWMTSQVSLHDTLKEGGRTSGGAGRQRLRQGMVAAEVALAMVLLVSAGLMIRSFYQLQNHSLGFDTANMLTVQIVLPSSGYPFEEPKRRVTFNRELLERVRTLPGVESAATVYPVPLSGNGWQSVYATEDDPNPPHDEVPWTEIQRVSPGYFKMMEIPLLKGRVFNAQDTDAVARVIIVDDKFAERHWPGGDPLGKRIRMGHPGGEDIEEAPWQTVVGVVGHIKLYGAAGREGAELYFPNAQSPLRSMVLGVRTAGDPLALTEAVRREVLSVDPGQPIYRIRTMDSLATNWMGRQRVSMLLLGGFAALALVLASIGIYGVLSYHVGQATHEIGLRMALGAQRGDVLGLIVKQGMMVVLVGLAIGSVAAFGFTRFLGSLLFDVAPTDPATFGIVAVTLAGVALAACYIPARRATRVDPMVALRYE